MALFKGIRNLPRKHSIEGMHWPKRRTRSDGRYRLVFSVAPCCSKCSFLSWLVLHFLLAHLSLKLKWAFLITCRQSSVPPSVCKLFTFSSSSPEPLGEFQPNLAQSILGWRGFKFVQMKGPRSFPRGDNYKWCIVFQLSGLIAWVSLVVDILSTHRLMLCTEL